MGWNYRVIKIANKKDLIERFNCEPYYYQIMETYYDEQGEPNGFGSPRSSETYETLKKLWDNNLKLIKEAFSKPVIIVNENFMVTGYENNNEVIESNENIDEILEGGFISRFVRKIKNIFSKFNY